MTPPQPLACHLHDYLEVACLFGYRVRLTLRDGSTVEGMAETTLTLPGSLEVLRLDVDGQPRELPLCELVSLRVLTEAARFELVHFSAEGAPD